MVYDALNKHGRERNPLRYEPEFAKESSSLTSCNCGLLLVLKTCGKSNARVVLIHLSTPQTPTPSASVSCDRHTSVVEPGQTLSFMQFTLSLR